MAVISVSAYRGIFSLLFITKLQSFALQSFTLQGFALQGFALQSSTLQDFTLFKI